MTLSEGNIIAATVGGPVAFVLLFGIYYVISNFIAKFLYLWINLRGRIPTFYYLLIAPGTIAHETAHYIACLLTGTEVYRVKLFQMPTDDGVLGFVEHEKINDVYKQTIVSLAPLFFCFLLILVLIQFLLPGLSFFPFEYDFQAALFSWEFLLFAYLTISLIAASAPSSADFACVFNVLYEKPQYLAHAVLTIAVFYITFLWAFFDESRPDLDAVILSLTVASAFFLVFWLLSLSWGMFGLGTVIGLGIGLIISLLMPCWDMIAVVSACLALVSGVLTIIGIYYEPAF